MRGGYLVLLFLVLLTGCGGGDAPTRLPVKGQVVQDAKPVNGGFLIFRPADPQSALIINANVETTGNFELFTVFNNERSPGIPEGEYTVTYMFPPQDKEIASVTLPQPVKVDANTSKLVIEISVKQ